MHCKKGYNSMKIVLQQGHLSLCRLVVDAFLFRGGQHPDRAFGQIVFDCQLPDILPGVFCSDSLIPFFQQDSFCFGNIDKLSCIDLHLLSVRSDPHRCRHLPLFTLQIRHFNVVVIHALPPIYTSISSCPVSALPAVPQPAGGRHSRGFRNYAHDRSPSIPDYRSLSSGVGWL